MATIFSLCLLGYWYINPYLIFSIFGWVFKKSTDNVHRESIKGFLWITGLRSLEIYLAALLPIYIGVYILYASILLTFIMPITSVSKDEHFQVDLPHLIERLSLLVIITFGEMIMGLVKFFTIENFSIYSVLYFIIMSFSVLVLFCSIRPCYLMKNLIKRDYF